MNAVSLRIEFQPLKASAYPIWIGEELLANPSVWIPPKTGTVAIITDHWVEQTYASRLEKVLNLAGYSTLLFSFPPGENAKNSQTKDQLEDQMLTQGCDRDTLIIALGGGVVGDLAGFIAATFMRGIPYIQVPTTLLAMLDSSVGGKTGIDTPRGKNLIGAFWQPKAVVSDINCLHTLPMNHRINGLIEAIKIALTSDREALNRIALHLDAILNLEASALIPLIQSAVQKKAEIVGKDERESSQRAILNFGHTVGHALEQLSGYRLLHGYGVALGILVEAKIAQLKGLLDESAYQTIKNLFQRLDISGAQLKAFHIDEVIAATQLDKKKRKGEIHYVLLNDLGQVYQTEQTFTHPVSDEVVKHAFLLATKD